MPAGWLTRSRADVPPGEAWLSARERDVLAHLRLERRRDDWRLGRWAAKAALGARTEILAAPDGAPEAWSAGERLPVSLSISHREGRALVAVAEAPMVVGCDLEWLEPRTDAFVNDWLAPYEQTLAGRDRVLIPNLVWTAKEAAAKVRREGLRLDLRHAVTRLGEVEGDGWRALTVALPDGETCGWWRLAGGFVLTVATTPAGPPPVQISRSNSSR